MAQAKNVAQGSWVTVIDSRPLSTAKLRVAAYARVSSDSEDQINSYIAQVDYYTKHIASKEEWEMVDVYADACAIIALTGKTLTAKGVAPL